MTRTVLATSAQVLREAKINSEDEVGGSEVVDDAIEEAREEVTGDFGDPQRRSNFTLDSNQTEYEFSVDKKLTFSVEKVYIIQDDLSRREYTSGTASEANQKYTLDKDFNKITFAADTISTFNGNRVIVDWIPNWIHLLVRLKAALGLIDRDAITNADENSPAPGLRILQRIQRLEKAVTVPGVAGSEDNIVYDPTFGEVIPQRRFRTT